MRKDAIEAIASCSGGVPLPLLVDMRSMRSIAREARKQFAQTTVSSRVALLVESALSSTLANFFLGLSRPDVPMRVFTDEADALAWLNDGGT